MMKAVIVSSPGGSDKLTLSDSVPRPQLTNPDYILVKVYASGLNRADIMQREGKYPPPKGESEIMGLEVAGTVEEVGSNVKGWSKGDRVAALVPGGGYAQFCAVPAVQAMKIPDHFSFEDAAAVPEAYLTAYQALKWHGNLSDGKAILIHAGASGVGIAAIHIAKQFSNTKVIVTAGSEDKLKLCSSLGADFGINYKTDKEFSKKVLEATNGKGVDILIDFVGGPYWTENIASLAEDGIMIILAFLGGPAGPSFDMSAILRKRLQIKGSTLRSRSIEYKGKLTSELHDFIFDRLKDGRIKPVVAKIFDWKNVKEAHEFMEGNHNAGKIIMNNIQE